MQDQAIAAILSICATPEAKSDTVLYLAEELKKVIRKEEAVLICFPSSSETSIGAVLGQVVRRCGGIPVFWGEDLRWKALLQTAFLSRASTIIGPPLTILGLSKLTSFHRTPLWIVNAVTTGYPCLDWMLDDIVSGLDCKVWGILTVGLQCIVAGASCDRGRGIHLRDDLFDIAFTEQSETRLPGGRWGEVMLFHKAAPQTKVPINAYAFVPDEPCSCGRSSRKLVNMDYGHTHRASDYKIMEDLLYWNSILDCRVERTEQGRKIEVICFPGLKLPKFPECAEFSLRVWNPETDVPFEIAANWRKHL